MAIGSAIYNFNRKIGVGQAVDKLAELFQKDCGCSKRAKALDLFEEKVKYNTKEKMNAIKEAYKQIFGEKIKMGQCAPCNKRKIEKIINSEEYKAYKAELEKRDDPTTTTAERLKMNMENITPDLNSLTLKQLRQLYPDIKSISKAGFIKQIK